ncbi:MAG: esterase/lipase family protein [Frankiaceae bacterium]
MRSDEIRGVAKLLGHALAGGTERVSEAHQAIADRAFGEVGEAGAAQVVHDRVADAVYSILAPASAMAPGAGAMLAEGAATDTSELSSSRAGRLLTGVVNGLYGDFLAREAPELAVSMSVRAGEAGTFVDLDAVPQGLPADTGGKVVAFVHGLCESDESWFWGSKQRHGSPGISYGSLLRDDLGYFPVYVRCNSGLHVSDNGRQLARTLQRLTDGWPAPVEEIALVGHSMGGLVARGACHYADTGRMRWTKSVRHVVTLGTPHLSAPMERGVHVAQRVLSQSRETRSIAKILGTRSVGIRDLRYGSIVDEDWWAVDPEEFLQDRCREVPFLPDATYYFIAVTVTKEADGPVATLLGDLFVQYPSASGRSARRGVPFELEHGRHIGRLHHFDLLNHPAVYAHIRSWFAEVWPLS